MIIPLIAVPKPRMTRADSWKKRECVTTYWKYKDDLRVILGNKRISGRLHVVFYLPMPTTWSQKKKDKQEEMPCTVKPDIDNLVKGLMDALEANDSFIYSLVANKVYSQNPRIFISDDSFINQSHEAIVPVGITRKEKSI